MTDCNPIANWKNIPHHFSIDRIYFNATRKSRKLYSILTKLLKKIAAATYLKQPSTVVDFGTNRVKRVLHGHVALLDQHRHWNGADRTQALDNAQHHSFTEPVPLRRVRAELEALTNHVEWVGMLEQEYIRSDQCPFMNQCKRRGQKIRNALSEMIHEHTYNKKHYRHRDRYCDFNQLLFRNNNVDLFSQHINGRIMLCFKK